MFVLMLMFTIGSSTAVNLEDLYPFGPENGDAVYNKDISHHDLEISLDLPFPFFGKDYSRMFISNHGIVSFDTRTLNCPGGCKLYSEKSPMVSMFLVPSSNRRAGEVYSRVSNDPNVLERASQDICRGKICSNLFAE